MPARLYVIPASHPSTVARRAFELKGVPFEAVDLVPVFHKLHQKARFGGGGTVPGAIFEDGTRVLGSRAIVRELERRHPEPRLGSDDPRVNEAEAWGDEVLQPLVRRVIWQALSRDPGAQMTYVGDTRLFPPVPRAMARLSAGMVGWAERRINGASDAAARADLANLPLHLDRIDMWLEQGVLGAEPAGAADLQVASGLRLMLTSGDLAPCIAGRPAEAFALRVFPEYPGHVGRGALPAEWLPAAA